jgi:hypothetical protein
MARASQGKREREIDREREKKKVGREEVRGSVFVCERGIKREREREK